MSHKFSWRALSACAALLTPGCLDPFPEDPGGRPDFGSVDEVVPLPNGGVAPAGSGAVGPSSTSAATSTAGATNTAGGSNTAAGSNSAAGSNAASTSGVVGDGTATTSVSPPAVTPTSEASGSEPEVPSPGEVESESDAGVDSDAGPDAGFDADVAPDTSASGGGAVAGG